MEDILLGPEKKNVQSMLGRVGTIQFGVQVGFQSFTRFHRRS